MDTCFPDLFYSSGPAMGETALIGLVDNLYRLEWREAVLTGRGGVLLHTLAIDHVALTRGFPHVT